MVQLQSERLDIIALTVDQLTVLSRGRNGFEREYGYTESGIDLGDNGFFMQLFDKALNEFILPNVRKHPGSYGLFTHWIIVDRLAHRIVGGIGAGGLPGKDGGVMIGYFMDRRFNGQGRMTEALNIFKQWLFVQRGVRLIIADTPAEHIASQKVLQKNGFVFRQKVDEGVQWICRPDTSETR